MTGCQTCGGFGNRHDPVAHGDVPKPGPCRNCGCPWDSCLIHSEFCCDACAHFDEPTAAPTCNPAPAEEAS